jgi:hypothetical protein
MEQNKESGETGMVILPKLPHGRADFEDAVSWATGYFDCAQALDLGLDEGQRAILASLVKRLDQLDREVFLWPEGEPDGD